VCEAIPQNTPCLIDGLWRIHAVWVIPSRKVRSTREVSSYFYWQERLAFVVGERGGNSATDAQQEDYSENFGTNHSANSVSRPHVGIRVTVLARRAYCPYCPVFSEIQDTVCGGCKGCRVYKIPKRVESDVCEKRLILLTRSRPAKVTSASQAECRRFDPGLPLHRKAASTWKTHCQGAAFIWLGSAHGRSSCTRLSQIEATRFAIPDAQLVPAYRHFDTRLSQAVP
jgi:hypothetical protein